MIGSHVIVDSSTLARGPQDVPMPGPKTLYLGVTGWTNHRASALQFTRSEDAQAYVDDCKRRHRNMMSGRQVLVINHVQEGEGQPVGRGKVTTDYNPFDDE